MPERWKQYLHEKISGIHARLFLAYFSILIILALMVWIYICYSNYQAYRRQEQENLIYTANAVSSQLDYMVKQMDYILLDAVSDIELVESMQDIHNMGEGYTSSANGEELHRLNNSISASIVSESAIRNLNRLTVFNQYGYFASTNVDKTSHSAQVINNLNWLDKVREQKGLKVLLAPVNDPWGFKTKEKVVSLVRLIRNPGKEIGFIEAQMNYRKMEEICHVNEQYNIVVLDAEKQIFFSNNETENYIPYLAKWSKEETAHVKLDWNASSGEIVCLNYSPYTGLYTIVAENLSERAHSLGILWNDTLVLMVLAFSTAVLVILLWSHRVLQPLIALQRVLEQNDLDTLQRNAEVQINTRNIKEINSLVKSFRKMNLRLEGAMDEKIKAKEMQLQAHFDALQAQINPHFMHNMLNVVANMVYEERTEEILEICNLLSENLRYSTSNKQPVVTIAQELDFTENYLKMMKKRLEHKLEYSIIVKNEAIRTVEIPKLILLPFVENSLSHAYYDGNKRKIKIEIYACMENNMWKLLIQDNGEGFPQDMLDKIQTNIAEYKRNMEQGKSLKGFEIGGMGIINTYVRMWIYFKDKIELSLDNIDDGGAKVVIRGKTDADRNL